MVFKTLPIVSLETIYEESTSRTPSLSNSRCDLDEERFSGLISSRSISSVSFERQRLYEHKKNRLPIEVQFRNGSKQFIHPTTTPSKFRRTKRPLVLTIITADDLRQAGITPGLSSSTSGSDLSIRSLSQASSPFVRIKSLEDIQEALENQQSTITPTTEISVETVSSKHENENFIKAESSQLVPIESRPSPASTATVIHTNPSKPTRSIFKPIPFNIQPISIRPRTSSTLVSKPNPPVQQQKVSHPTIYQPNITFVSYQMPTNSTTYPYNSSLISSEKNLQLTSNLQSLLQTNLSNYPSYSLQYPTYPTTSINQQLSNYPWQIVHTNSLYDLPLLSKQYSNRPLGIVLPMSQVQKQDFPVTHDPVMARYLLNAGLTLDTVGLYERVLDIAAARQQHFS